MIPRTLLQEESSLEFWYKDVEYLGIPSPKTKIVKLTKKELEAAHSEHLLGSVTVKLMEAAEEFEYPIFLRTDLSSGKHAWDTSCYVDHPDKISRHAHEVMVYNLVADMFGLPFRSFAVREFIPLEGGELKAFYGNFPVTKERRVFVRDGIVECHHEYWVEGAIEQGMSHKEMPREEWQPLLDKVNAVTEDDVAIIVEYARRIGKRLGGYWSVDFAKTTDHQWILIDMGRGELSFHKEGCRYLRHPKQCMCCRTRITDAMFEEQSLCRRCKDKPPTKESEKDEFKRTW
jgi:hypothetical protein